MSKLQEKFDQLIQEQRKLQQEFQRQAQAIFKETTKEFFDANPQVTAITWKQFTPYFNDGDECVFQVYPAAFTNAPDPENVRWGEYDGEEENVWVYDTDYGSTDIPEGAINVEMADAFSGMLQTGEMESVMKAMFEDHVTVTATREGFEVEEYSHD